MLLCFFDILLKDVLRLAFYSEQKHWFAINTFLPESILYTATL